MSAYPGTVYRSHRAGPVPVFTVPFIVLVGCIFAACGAVLAYALMIPIIAMAVAGFLIGLGVGAVCWLIERGRYDG